MKNILGKWSKFFRVITCLIYFTYKWYPCQKRKSVKIKKNLKKKFGEREENRDFLESNFKSSIRVPIDAILRHKCKLCQGLWTCPTLQSVAWESLFANCWIKKTISFWSGKVPTPPRMEDIPLRPTLKCNVAGNS